MPLLSVIIPSFNEEENIERTSETVGKVLRDAGICYEIIFVSDGSRDLTYEKVTELAKQDSRIRGLRFSRNFGKEASIFAGLSAAKGDCAAVMDCDLQHPAEILPLMYEKWKEGFDVVEGIKSSRGKEGIFHRMFVGIFYGIMSKLMKMDMNSTSDFKLIDRRVIDCLLDLKEKNTFFRALTFWTGFKSVTVDFDVAKRVQGRSKWSFFGLVKYAIMNTTSFTTIPLQLITFLGVFSLLFSLVFGIQTLVRYLMNRSVEGFTTVILLVLIIGGFIMISLGIIGLYLSRIYEEVKGRPKFIIRETTDDTCITCGGTGQDVRSVETGTAKDTIQ